MPSQLLFLNLRRCCVIELYKKKNDLFYFYSSVCCVFSAQEEFDVLLNILFLSAKLLFSGQF